VRIWPQDVCERGLTNAAIELRAAEEHWIVEKKRADLIAKIAAYRLARAVAIYEKFREMLGEFVEVPEEFPEIEPFEARPIQPVSAVEHRAAAWSAEKERSIAELRARLLAESMPAAKRLKLSDFGSGCFDPAHPMFCK
jgi:hypothetical protein